MPHKSGPSDAADTVPQSTTVPPARRQPLPPHLLPAIAAASLGTAVLALLRKWLRAKEPKLGAVPDAVWLQHTLHETIPLTRAMAISVVEASPLAIPSCPCLFCGIQCVHGAPRCRPARRWCGFKRACKLTTTFTEQRLRVRCTRSELWRCVPGECVHIQMFIVNIYNVAQSQRALRASGRTAPREPATNITARCVGLGAGGTHCSPCRGEARGVHHRDEEGRRGVQDPCEGGHVHLPG